MATSMKQFHAITVGLVNLISLQNGLPDAYLKQQYMSIITGLHSHTMKNTYQSTNTSQMEITIMKMMEHGQEL